MYARIERRHPGSAPGPVFPLPGNRRRERTTAWSTCPMCHGRGEVIYQQSFLQIRRTCNQCGGRGQIVRRPCTQCRGERQIRTERKLKVTSPPAWIPARISSSSNEGQPGLNSGPPGDLYVVIKVKEHPIFERQGDDLHCTIPINCSAGGAGSRNRSAHLRWARNRQDSGRRSERVAHQGCRTSACRVCRATAAAIFSCTSTSGFPASSRASSASFSSSSARHCPTENEPHDKRLPRQSQRLLHVRR